MSIHLTNSTVNAGQGVYFFVNRAKDGIVAMGANSSLPTAFKIGAAVVCGSFLLYKNLDKAKEAASYAYSIIKGTPPQGPND